MNAYRVAALAVAMGIVMSASARSQTRDEPIASLGQPKRFEFDAAAMFPLTGSVGIYRSILNPLTGLLGARVEGAASVDGPGADLRALVEAKALGLSAGIDWSLADNRGSPMLRFQTAVRRGGIVSHGSMARVDWVWNGRNELMAGLAFPLGDPLAGRTRPKRTTVRLSDVRRGRPMAADKPDASTREAFRQSLAYIAAYSNAFASRPANVLAHDARGYVDRVAAYDTLVVRAFRSDDVARFARQAMLEDVVVPIDSLFGQAKASRDLGPLVGAARSRFARTLADSGRLTTAARSAALATFDAWSAGVVAAYDDLLNDAGDSRLVWLPLEIALTPRQFNDQTEVDSLLARAVGHPFTDQNALTYLRSGDLPLEIARSIYATRRYHVLWIHDFTGRRESGAIDNVSYEMVADAYLPALTAAVKRYDSTGVLPAYIILQDQFFYEPRDNRLWMNILEAPLTASMRLSGDTTRDRERHLLDRQRELREAVAASRRLQRDARASDDPDEWLRQRVKVHVNIVEPSDFSFRSSHIIPGIPFTPDNIMRDHRKLVFYDLDERDPYAGALLVMGVGIGEHYASATWEDRGYRVRGPATLEARRAVRAALVRTGMHEDRIPPPLRAVESPKTVEEETNRRDYVGRALQVTNAVGFGDKASSVARAMLYNVAQPGSILIVPDPMWLSDTWAGMLAAAAARGCKVYIVAPAAANAPSPQAPLLAVEHRVLSRLLALRDSLAEPIRRSGGDLRVGIFAAHAQTTDVAGRLREVREGLARAPWIRRVIPFDREVLAVLERPDIVASDGNDATSFARDEKPRAPQLHSKSQLLARPGAIATLLQQPGWEDALAASLQSQARQTSRFADELGFTTPDVDTTASRATDTLLRSYEQAIPEAERRRVSFYFSVGTQNEDPRGLVSDGETTMIVSGVQASVGLIDLFTLMARSQWIEDQRSLERYVKRPSGFMRWLAWKLRAAF
jgi:hypothetical protein